MLAGKPVTIPIVEAELADLEKVFKEERAKHTLTYQIQRRTKRALIAALKAEQPKEEEATP